MKQSEDINTADTIRLVQPYHIMQLFNSKCNNRRKYMQPTPKNLHGVKTMICSSKTIIDCMWLMTNNIHNVEKIVYIVYPDAYAPYSDIINFKNLRHLKLCDITGTTIYNSILQAIATHHNLEIIEFVNCNGIYRNAIDDFRNQVDDLFPNFKYMKVNGEPVYSTL